MFKVFKWLKEHHPKYLIEWFKRLCYIVKNYDHDLIDTYDKIRACELKVNDGVNCIKERTNIHADIHMRSSQDSQIIMIGRYRNTDYVQTFSVDPEDFGHLIQQLREMEKYGVVRKIDAPPMMMATLKNELDYWRE